MLTQIPMRSSRKMRVVVDHSLYSLRNLVGRCFNKLKNARRVATRYDKTAESEACDRCIAALTACVEGVTRVQRAWQTGNPSACLRGGAGRPALQTCWLGDRTPTC